MEQTIGERIRAQRQLRKMSMQALADAIGKSKGNISGYEKGDYEPSAQTVVAIARVFGVSTDWLLTGEEFRNQNVKSEARTELNEAEDDLVMKYRTLDERDKRDISDYLHLKYQRYEKERRTTDC